MCRAAAGEPAQDLEEFIAEDDQLLFGSGQTMMVAMPSGVPAERPLLTDYTLAAKLAKLEIINVQRTIESFHSYLRGLQMTDMERLRPSWDTYFMVSWRRVAQGALLIHVDSGRVRREAHKLHETGRRVCHRQSPLVRFGGIQRHAQGSEELP